MSLKSGDAANQFNNCDPKMPILARYNMTVSLTCKGALSSMITSNFSSCGVGKWYHVPIFFRKYMVGIAIQFNPFREPTWSYYQPITLLHPHLDDYVAYAEF